MNKDKRFSVMSSYLGMYQIFDDKKREPLNSRKVLKLLEKNEELKEEIDGLKRRNKKLNKLCIKYSVERSRLEEENKQLEKEDELFFKKVFDILLKYQDLFNREMADEVLEELGIELTRWFE